MKYNFDKISTLNQGTSYDYNSVMQYHKYAQSVLIAWCIVVTVVHGLFEQLVAREYASVSWIIYKQKLHREINTHILLTQNVFAVWNN